MEKAEQIAIYWQKIGKKYGLLEIFKENGII